MLLLLIAWLSIKSLIQTRKLFSIVPMLVGVALGFGLSAPAWMALLDLVQGSARELQSAAAHWQWRVPLAGLPGGVVPPGQVDRTVVSFRRPFPPPPAVRLGPAGPPPALAPPASRAAPRP